jgi:hypothetical protein
LRTRFEILVEEDSNNPNKFMVGSAAHHEDFDISFFYRQTPDARLQVTLFEFSGTFHGMYQHCQY